MKKIHLIWTAAIILILVGIFWSFGKGSKGNNNLYAEDKISHGHGLAVDVADSNKVYIATHYGLLLLINEKDLYRIGKSRDDYMGFSPHPINSQIFFSSGHPARGGNIGVQKSEDSGVMWKKISQGANGPVDFHAMAISPVNPNILYGWYNNRLQRSLDGGQTFSIVETNVPSILQLVADSRSEDIVFATTLQGLIRSKDKGVTWENVSEDLKDDVVVTVAIHPQDSKKLLSFSQKLGVARSNDSGVTFTKISEDFGGELLLYIAIDKNNPDRVYALTKNNLLYRSLDSGNTWVKIR